MSLEARAIDTGESSYYDAFIEASPEGHILQSYAWGQVKARTGWRPLYLVVEDAGSIKAAALFLRRGLPFGGKSILYSPRGPVLDMNDHRLFDFFLNEVRKIGRREKSVLWKIDPAVPVGVNGVVPYLESRGFKPTSSQGGFAGTQPRYVFLLDISPSSEELMASFHPKTRYNIRLAERRGVTVREECSREDMPVFYQILTETAGRDRFLIRKLAYFEAIWDELVSRNRARLFLAYYRNEPIAGALAFTIGKKAWYIYGASASCQREVMPNHLVQWTIINWAKRIGCVLYDFRGVPGDDDPQNPLYGLYRFKKGFSGRHTEFIGEYDLPLSRFWYSAWRLGLPLYYDVIHHLARRRRGSLEPTGGQTD